MIRTTLTAAFWNERLERNRSTALPDQWAKYEKVGTLENFRIAAAGGSYGRRGYFYTDSDLHKWADAASRALCSLSDENDPAGTVLIDLLSQYADLMLRAMTDDGYLFTWNQIYFPHVRWKNLRIEHELYCMGHFIEAGVSHWHATGSRNLLDLAIRSADLIVGEFLDDYRDRFPGHQEVEIALLRLDQVHHRTEYRDMAAAFLDRRGRRRFPGFRLVGELISHGRRSHWVRQTERKAGAEALGFELGENLGDDEPPFLALKALGSFLSGAYLQEHRSADTQVEPKGHSVRWVYGQFAESLLAEKRPDESTKRVDRMEQRWESLAGEKTYITGGIGSLPVIEGFGRRFELDNRYSYSETCAAIGSAWWNRELSATTGLPRYADMVERLLYNGASAGLSLDGRNYSYRNPLESAQGMDRHEWFATACCPSNISRFLAGLDEMILSAVDRSIRVDQYISCRSTLSEPSVAIEMESSLPWDGVVRLGISCRDDIDLQLRIPGWAGTWNLSLDGEDVQFSSDTPPALYQKEFLAADYATFFLPAGSQAEILLSFSMEPRLIRSDPRVKGNRGRAALCRGPIVYCLESDGTDMSVPDPSSLRFSMDDGSLGGRTGVLSVGNRTFIPYYAWGNRGRMPMRVWLDDLN